MLWVIQQWWLQVASVPELEPFVLFMDGRPGEKRYLTNVDEILPQLQSSFPGTHLALVAVEPSSEQCLQH